MPQLKKLTIENFRQFDRLEIDGLSKVNFFVGKNNCGKTSILEALFFLFGMSNIRLLNVVNEAFRHNPIKKTIDLLGYFRNLSSENKPSFQGEFDNNDKRHLNFKQILYIEDVMSTVNKNNNNSSINNSAIDSKQNKHSHMSGIEIGFSIYESGKSVQSYGRKIIYNEHDRTINVEPTDLKKDENYIEKLQACYVLDHFDDEAALKDYSDIVIENNKNEMQFILNLLKNIDSKIKNIQPTKYGIYFECENIKNLIPIGIIGEGIKRLFSIITTVVLNKNSFICIDEIENGLHYSAYKLLLKGLLDLSEKYDIQLFITTHSLELLTHLKSLLAEENNAEKRDIIKIFSITKTAKWGYQACGYSYDSLDAAIENNIELRG